MGTQNSSPHRKTGKRKLTSWRQCSFNNLQNRAEELQRGGIELSGIGMK